MMDKEELYLFCNNQTLYEIICKEATTGNNPQRFEHLKEKYFNKCCNLQLASDEELFCGTTETVVFALTIIICFMGCLGNSTTFAVIHGHFNRNMPNFLLKVLTLAYSAVLLFSLASQTVEFMPCVYFLEDHRIYRAHQICIFFLRSATVSAVYIVVLIVCCRSLSTYYPYKLLQIWSPIGTYAWLLAIFILAAVANMLLIIDNHWTHVYRMVYNFVIVCGIPLIMLSSCLGIMVQDLRRHKSSRYARKYSRSVSGDVSCSKLLRLLFDTTEITSLLVTIAALFMAALAVVLAQSVLTYMAYRDEGLDYIPLMNLAHLAVDLNAASSFLVYFLLRKTFRQKLMMFCSHTTEDY